MANFKPIIRNDRIKPDGKTNVQIRISYLGKVRYIKTEYSIFPNQIDKDSGLINKKKHPNAKFLNEALELIIDRYEACFVEYDKKTHEKDIHELVNYIKDIANQDQRVDFIEYYTNYIEKLRLTRLNSYPDSHETTLNQLKIFIKIDKIYFEDINFQFLKNFEEHLLQEQKKTNTIAVYMRNIRTIINYAINNDIIGYEFYPFRKYKIKTSKTNKRNLDIDNLKALYNYKPENNGQEKAIDLFFLSFFLIGINFKDLLYAKKTDILNNRLYYDRFKTNKSYSIKIYKPAYDIIKKYAGKDEFLLNILENKLAKNPKPDRSSPLHKDVISTVNRRLKSIANDKNKLNLNIPISTYYSRHTWATIAKNVVKTEKYIVSLALGHGNNTVTDVYIGEDLTPVDEANEKIINLLLEKE